MRNKGNGQTNKYGRRSRRRHDRGSARLSASKEGSRQERRARSHSRTSNSSRTSHPLQNEVRCPEIDPDIDGVPMEMDELTKSMPWKDDEVTTDSVGLGVFEAPCEEPALPDHCWVGEYLDEGEEKDLTPLSHDVVAKEILDRLWQGQTETSASNMLPSQSITGRECYPGGGFHSNRLPIEKLGSNQFDIKTSKHICSENLMVDKPTSLDAGSVDFKNYDAVYNTFIRPMGGDLLGSENFRDNSSLRPPKVYDYGHGDSKLPAAKDSLIVGDGHTMFQKTNYNDASNQSKKSLLADQSRRRKEPTKMKLDEYKKKYPSEKPMSTQCYSSSTGNEIQFQGHSHENSYYGQVPDIDRFPMIEQQIEHPNYAETSQSSARKRDCSSLVSHSNDMETYGSGPSGTNYIANDNEYPTTGEFPITVLTSSYRQRQKYEEENISIEMIHQQENGLFLSESSLKTEPVSKKIQNTQRDERAVPRELLSESELFDASGTALFSPSNYKGSFNDTRKVLLDENKEKKYRSGSNCEEISSSRIVVKSHGEKIKSFGSNQREEVCTEEFERGKNLERNHLSTSSFPFFQDVEEDALNKQSDDSDDDHHSQSFRRRSMKSPTVGRRSSDKKKNRGHGPFQKQLSHKYIMIDDTGAKKGTKSLKVGEPKRKLDRRNFKQSSFDKTRSSSRKDNEEQYFGRQRECQKPETSSSSKQSSHVNERNYNQRKGEDTRKFENRRDEKRGISNEFPVSSRSRNTSHSHYDDKEIRGLEKVNFDRKSLNEESDEAHQSSMRISLSYDGHRSFTGSDERLQHEPDRRLSSSSKEGLTRTVKNSDLPMLKGSHEMVDNSYLKHEHIVLEQHPRSTVSDTDFTEIDMEEETIDEQHDTYGNRMLIDAEVYEKRSSKARWLQDYEIWFYDTLYPILVNDKTAKEAGLCDHMDFLRSATKGNRRSLSYIPRGEPAKQTLKFIALYKNTDVITTPAKLTNRNDFSLLEGKRIVSAMVDKDGGEIPSLLINTRNSPPPPPPPLPTQFLFNKMNSQSPPPPPPPQPAWYESKDESRQLRFIGSKTKSLEEASSAAKNSVPVKVKIRGTGTEISKGSGKGMSTYAISELQASKSNRFNITENSERKSLPRTLSKNKKRVKSWEDAILPPGSYEHQGNQAESIEIDNSNRKTIETIHLPLKSQASVKNSTKRKDTSRESTDTSKNGPDNHFEKVKKYSDGTTPYHEKTTISSTSHEKKIDQVNAKNKRSTTNNTNTKKDLKKNAMISKRSSSVNAQHSSSNTGKASEVSKKLIHKQAESTRIIKSTHKTVKVPNAPNETRKASERKHPDDPIMPKNKKLIDKQQNSASTDKKIQLAKSASIIQAKRNQKAVNFKGEEYTCIQVPVVKPIFTSAQERLLPIFKQQVEKSVIRKGLNVLYKFEKYRITRIIKVVNDTLELFLKSYKSSDFNADHAVYCIWCLFENPTKNALDEINRRLKRVNLDEPYFLENLETFLLFQKTVFNLCYDQLNARVGYLAQDNGNIRNVRIQSENFFPQFHGESHVMMKLWSWCERMYSVFDNNFQLKRDSEWNIFSDGYGSHKSLEDKLSAYLKGILKKKIYQTPDSLSCNIIYEVVCQLRKEKQHATKQQAVMLVVHVWIANYFREGQTPVQNKQENFEEIETDSNILENLVILDEVYSDESDLDDDRVELEVDVSDEVSSLASVQVIDLF